MPKQPSEYERKLIDMQLGMRENQMEMKDTFAELDNWSKEIKVKEKKLLEDPDSFKDAKKGLPPIRSLATTKKKKKVKTKEKDEVGKSKKKSVAPRDAKAWDKLDIDKMCEEVDAHKSSESEYTTDDEWEEEQKKTRANWEKERGNVFFKDNLLNEAINCYTKAMDLDPANNVYPANRAMCLIKQEKYAAAEMDCTLSLDLDPKYVKALHRRATCRTKLNNFEGAKKDLEALLKLEPSNKHAQVELNQVIQLIDTRQLVFPVVKKESEKSKKELRRIVIEEINDDENSERAEMERTQEQIRQRLTLSSNEEKLFEVDKESKNVYKEEIKSEEIIEKKKNLMQEKVIPVAKKTVPDVPSNGYQFKKDWQYLNDNFEQLSEYFKKIPPKQYNSLFMNGLESDYLSKILVIYKTYYFNDIDLLFTNLKCLSELKRFKTQLMFLSSDDKQVIKDLMNQLSDSKKIPESDLKALIENYTE